MTIAFDDDKPIVQTLIRGAQVVDAQSTSTPLGGAGEYNNAGPFTEVLGFAMLSILVFADQGSAVDGLIVEWSSDGVNVDVSDVFTIKAGKGKTFSFGTVGRYVRIRYVNGATAQGAFRLQTLLNPLPFKGSSHRLSDAIVEEDDAELVKSIITGKKPDGVFDNVELETDGRMRTSIPLPTAPVGTTPVANFYDNEVAVGNTAEDVYTITNGKILSLQQFTGGCEGGGSGCSVQLVERTTAGGDQVIEVGYALGNNFIFPIDTDFAGDGDRRIVVKRSHSGGTSAMRITAKWRGYET